MKAIFFDTNVLFYSSSFLKKEDFDRLIANEFLPLTCEIVVMEGKDNNFRNIKQKYEKLIAVINDDKTNLYFHTKDLIKADFDKAFNESNNRIDNFLSGAFQGTIIKNQFKENQLDILFSRYRYKMPPFSDAESASDKGWKDTLIWLSLIGFAKDSDILEYWFVSNDRSFRDNSDKLKNEFKELTGKEINFLSIASPQELLEGIGLEKKKKVIEKNTISADKVKKIKDSIANIMNLYINDEFGNKITQNTFIFQKRLSTSEVEKICDNIEKSLESYIFVEKIDLSPKIREITGDCQPKALFSFDEVKSFVDSWCEIKSTYPDKKFAFLEAVALSFNTMVENNWPDDLPF